MYPSLDEITALHKKYAPNEELFHLVFTHCNIVLTIADQLIEKNHLQVNYDLIRTGALVHDIASYKYMAQKKELGETHYYRHAFEGSNILREEKYPDDVCRLVEHHLGVGLTKQEILDFKMDLPAKDFMPTTIEERLILYADKFHSKTPKFNAYESYLQFVAQFGEDAVKRFESLAKEFGVPEIESLAKKYKHPII